MTNGWKTVTIPMSNVANYNTTDAPDATFQKICEDRNAGSYRNFLIFGCNGDIEFSDAITYKAKAFTQPVYVDNFRVVSIASIAVSDF